MAEYRILKVKMAAGNHEFFAQVKKYWLFGLIPEWVYLDQIGLVCRSYNHCFPFGGYCKERAESMIDDHRRRLPVSSEVITK